MAFARWARTAVYPEMPSLPRLRGLAYGADYNPEQWSPEVWREDVRLMQEAGVNLVSVGIFSWAALQPEPEAFTPEWLDEVMDLLHEGGIAVNLATATASPPAWLIRRFPEVLPVTAAGGRLGPGSRQHYAPWSKVYRDHALPLVQFLARRYRAHPALVSWHINNEYACHTRESFDAGTAGQWRAWLRQRYGTIDRLNQAWHTSFWSQRYVCFDEISAPTLAPTLLNPGMALDWRRFCSDAFVDLVRAEAEILRNETPRIPISTNFVGWHDQPFLDHRAIAEAIDYVSWDSYPDPSGGLAEVQRNALCHDFMRSLKPGRAFLLMEQAPSAVNWRTFNQPRAPGVTRAFTHQAIARGADGALYFQWRQSPAGAEQFHSAMVPIVGHEVAGRPHRLWTMCCELGSELRTLGQLQGAQVRARVALLADYESMWALGHEGKPTRFETRSELARLHQTLWCRNVAVDVRHPEDDVSGYAVLLAPALYLISQRGAANLRAFVKRGGRLLFTPFCAVVDPTTRFVEGGFPGYLTDVFGFELEEWWPTAPGRHGALDGALANATWSEFAELGYATTADVRARFADEWFAGRPAWMCNQFGQGKAWYLAAHLNPAGLDIVVAEVLTDAGVMGIVATPAGVEAQCRENADTRFLYLVNHTAATHAVALADPAGYDMIRGCDVEGELALAPFGVAVVRYGLDKPVSAWE